MIEYGKRKNQKNKTWLPGLGIEELGGQSCYYSSFQRDLHSFTLVFFFLAFYLELFPIKNKENYSEM